MVLGQPINENETELTGIYFLRKFWVGCQRNKNV
jgi:hypothetical protein